jgi:uncharacterized iron-regulated protein
MRRLAVTMAFGAFAALVGHAQTTHVPHRVFDGAKGALTDFESMLEDLAKADVVFVGEQHDDTNTHRLELMLAQGLARRRSVISISLEMFERDVQPALTDWLCRRMTEQAFLAVSRPWRRYDTDYRPLVMFARDNGWPVIAANVPRALASDVSRSGIDVLRTKSDAEKTWFAADLKCPTDDEYFRRFAEAMHGHGVSGSADERTVAAERQTLEHFYQAQCLKDETMAESIARAWLQQTATGARPLVVHYNGTFHSDFSLGTAERTARRLPGSRVVVISILPVMSDALDSVSPDDAERSRAAYLVYTTDLDGGGRRP